MRDLSRFGTEDYPLHPSAMRTLVVCPWRSVMDYLATEHDDSSGAAADTGSAMHAAAAAFHQGKGVAESIGIMSAGIDKYKQADLRDAANLFLHYAGDPRNSGARILLVEHPIAFQISPAAHDPTQAPIQVEGRLDQVREQDGTAVLWDIKTTKRDPAEVVDESLFQAAAYCIGATVALGRIVQPGGLIFPRRYPGNAHRSFAWRFNDIEQIMEGVRNAVALVRMGRLSHNPNPDCRWCSARSPELCLPQLQELNLCLRSI